MYLATRIYNGLTHYSCSPFSLDWWVWLAFTGINIGCVISVKWVGFFVTALVGMYTIEDLWNKFGDLRMPKVRLPVRLPLAMLMFR